MGLAQQVESLWNGLTDNSGQPLAGGKVTTYLAGTTTPVALWTNSTKSASATNPIILDAYGRAQVYADGAYKFMVQTAGNTTLYTLDNLVYGYDDGQLIWGATSGGAGNAQTITVSGSITSYAAGQRYIFIAGNSNTGSASLSVNGLGAVAIVKGPASASLGAGDIRAGQLVDVVYETGGGGRFRLMNYPTLQEIQNGGPIWLGTTGGSGNAQTASASPAITAYAAGQVFRFIAGATNTGAMTLAVNGLTAQSVFDVATNAALRSNQVVSGFAYEVLYDGTRFLLLNPNQNYISGYSPTITQGVTLSKTDTYSRYRIIGNICHWQYSCGFTSAGTPGGQIIVPLPIAAASGAYRHLGSALFADASPASSYVMSAMFDGGSTTNFLLSHDTSTVAWFGSSPAVTVASGDALSFNIFWEI